MPLSDEDLERIARLAGDAASSRDAVLALRGRFPGLAVTRVDAMDMRGESPVRRLAARDLYLVDARNHCWTVTVDPAMATGVVIADNA